MIESQKDALKKMEDDTKIALEQADYERRVIDTMFDDLTQKHDTLTQEHEDLALKLNNEIKLRMELMESLGKLLNVNRMQFN